MYFSIHFIITYYITLYSYKYKFELAFNKHFFLSAPKENVISDAFYNLNHTNKDKSGEGW